VRLPHGRVMVVGGEVRRGYQDLGAGRSAQPADWATDSVPLAQRAGGGHRRRIGCRGRLQSSPERVVPGRSLPARGWGVAVAGVNGRLGAGRRRLPARGCRCRCLMADSGARAEVCVRSILHRGGAAGRLGHDGGEAFPQLAQCSPPRLLRLGEGTGAWWNSGALTAQSNPPTRSEPQRRGQPARPGRVDATSSNGSAWWLRFRGGRWPGRRACRGRG
jgi:hypothetical protein